MSFSQHYYQNLFDNGFPLFGQFFFLFFGEFGVKFFLKWLHSVFCSWFFLQFLFRHLWKILFTVDGENLLYECWEGKSRRLQFIGRRSKFFEVKKCLLNAADLERRKMLENGESLSNTFSVGCEKRLENASGRGTERWDDGN